MIWFIAVVIWAIILLLPKAYNALKFIFSLAVLYGIREAFNSWADHHAVLSTTIAILFFGSIIGVWVVKQVQITKELMLKTQLRGQNKRVRSVGQN